MRYPVVLPSLRDPRLHVAAVIGGLQALGQTVLGFELSVAQILVCLGVCAAIEAGVALWRDRVLLWPASALLTGNSVAFIMRAAGTRHGDWWSLQGVDVFVVACVLSMASKLLLRRGGRHVFNPSNLGLVAAFVLFGTGRANPQDLWWGPLSPGLGLTLAVIVAGGLAIAGRLRMLGMCAAFLAALAAATAVVAASGHCITARWHYGAVCGEQYWSVMTTSPEVLVFMFFMVTDPRTTPAGRAARIAFGAAVGFLGALLAAPAQTEFATKVALLGALVVACGAMPLRPALRRLRPRRLRCRPAALLGVPAAAAALLVAGLPAHGAPAALPATPGTSTRTTALPPISISPEAQRTAGVDTATARALVGAALRQAPGPVLRAVVELVSNPARPQDAPRLAVLLQGAGWMRTVVP